MTEQKFVQTGGEREVFDIKKVLLSYRDSLDVQKGKRTQNSLRKLLDQIEFKNIKIRTSPINKVTIERYRGFVFYGSFLIQ